MVLSTYFKNNLAAALANETYVTPSYLTVSTSDTEPGSADTTISGEIGTRFNVGDGIRSNNEVEYNVTRLGSDVINSGGDSIKQIALTDTETGGNFMASEVIAGITQTTSFELDISVVVKFD